MNLSSRSNALTLTLAARKMLELDSRALALLAAIALDALIGDPQWIWRRFPHPVAALGALIAGLERRLNRTSLHSRRRRLAGAFALLAVTAVAGAAGLLLSMGATSLAGHTILPAWGVEAVLAMVFLAQRGLYEHVSDVVTALGRSGLEGGRKMVAKIVGRDPARLDESGICRASIESTAENFADGVVAPAFWYLLAGLPGLIAYKAINTADSMIGHRNARYRDFGWAAARTDDIANFVPARLSAIFIAISAAIQNNRGATSLIVAWRDARLHSSPNAGWPEAAMAGALDLALGGPRTYQGHVARDPWLNAAGVKVLTARHVRDVLRIYVGACLAQAATVAILAYLSS